MIQSISGKWTCSDRQEELRAFIRETNDTGKIRQGEFSLHVF
ncbi:hypothetical protein [Salinibacillus aidingensis]